MSQGYNPYRDADGKFASGPSGGGALHNSKDGAGEFRLRLQNMNVKTSIALADSTVHSPLGKIMAAGFEREAAKGPTTKERTLRSVFQGSKTEKQRDREMFAEARRRNKEIARKEKEQQRADDKRRKSGGGKKYYHNQ